MLKMRGDARGWLFVGLGTLLFASICGLLFVRISAALLSLIMVNYGLKALGMPPLFVLIEQWLDGVSRK